MASKDLQPLNESFARTFLRSQILHNRIAPPPAGTNLRGKVAIVSGGNTGIGFECARQLLELHASHVIITSRDKKRGDEAAARLRNQGATGTVDVWPLDMSSYDSVQKFGRRVESELPRLDLVVLNAGLSKASFGLIPATGHDENLQVNYLSTMLLATLLLPLLKNLSPRGEPGRLSIVSSGTVYASKFSNRAQVPLLKSFDDPSTAPEPGLQSYSTSKLIGHMFVYKLMDCVSPDDVIVNLVDPGGTKGTGFGRDLPKIAQAVGLPIFGMISRTVLDAAHTYLDALLVKGKESHGCFIMDAEIKPYPGVLYSGEGKDIIERVWEETLDEFDFANARGILTSLKN